MEPPPTPGWERERGPAGERASLAPHRGAVVMVLGILGLVVCFICGIVAWAMGNTDLAEMRAGRMDRAGEGMTNAGRICGMISVILAAAGVAVFLVIALTVGIGSASHVHISK